MSRIIIFIFLGIGINFIMGCNGQLENRYISKAIYIDGSLVNKEFNKKILLELDDKNGILCEDNNVHGVLTINQLDTTFQYHPAFRSIYGCRTNFILTQVNVSDLSLSLIHI